VFTTRKRFYAAVFLNNKKDDEAQDQFLSSFLIPEKINQPTTAATQNAAPTEKVKAANPDTTVKAAGGDAPVESAETPQADPEAGGGAAADAAATPKKRGPVSGGVLNGKAISLPQPEYPATAKAVGAAGVVVVRVTIDEAGTVISAVPVSGPQLLHQASINAAMQARFAPTLLVGEPVQVIGIITYSFVKQ